MLLGGIIGGVANVIANWDDIDGDFVKFNQYAFVGCVAGSTAVALAESEIGAPAIGMCVGGILNLGNSYIRGARGTDLLDNAASGTIWGGVSGFASMGIGAAVNELMNIPWTTDYPGVPGHGKEVTLGQAISRNIGQGLSDHIAQQGIANAEVILASFSSTSSGGGGIMYYGVQMNSPNDVGHSFVFDPSSGAAYEINHPNGGQIHGLKSAIRLGPKSVGYKWENALTNRGFWGFRSGRDKILLSPVFVPDKASSIAFFESFVGQEWNYHFITMNCKAYAVTGLRMGGATSIITYKNLVNPKPIQWSGTFTDVYFNPF